MAGLVLRGAFSQIGIGLLVGIPLAFLAGRLMASQLYGVSAYDPFSVAIAAIVLFASATIAGFVPVQRAATIEPMQALRSEYSADLTGQRVTDGDFGHMRTSGVIPNPQ